MQVTRCTRQNEYAMKTSAALLSRQRFTGRTRCRTRRWTAPFLVAWLAFAGCRRGERLPDTSSQTYADFVSAFYVGLAALQVGDDVRADAKLGEATNLVHGEPAGWANWGILALRQRNFDVAAQRFDRALSLDKEDDRVYYLQGLLESDRGNSAQAIADLREAVKRNPRDLRAIYLLASEVERQGDEHSEAEFQQLMEQLLGAEPNNLAALLELCRISAKRGEVRYIAERCQSYRNTIERVAGGGEAAA